MSAEWDAALTYLRERLDEDERGARLADTPTHWAAVAGQFGPEVQTGCSGSEWSRECNVQIWQCDDEQDGCPDEARVWMAEAKHIARWDPARVLAEVDAKRRIVDEHATEWRIVEWPHDQNGKGEALCCRRCQNAEYSEWHPAPGEAGVLPDGFVTPYVIAPCSTMRLLALPYADRDDFPDLLRLNDGQR